MPKKKAEKKYFNRLMVLELQLSNKKQPVEVLEDTQTELVLRKYLTPKEAASICLHLINAIDEFAAAEKKRKKTKKKVKR